MDIQPKDGLINMNELLEPPTELNFCINECPNVDFSEAVMMEFGDDYTLNDGQFVQACEAIISGWQPPTPDEMCEEYWIGLAGDPPASEISKDLLFDFMREMCEECTDEELEHAWVMFNVDKNDVASQKEFLEGCLNIIVNGWEPPSDDKICEMTFNEHKTVNSSPEVVNWQPIAHLEPDFCPQCSWDNDYADNKALWAEFSTDSDPENLNFDDFMKACMEVDSFVPPPFVPTCPDFFIEMDVNTPKNLIDVDELRNPH